LNIPISTSPYLRIPLFWLAFKNFPMVLLRNAATRALHADGYLNLFFHPWEFTDIHRWHLPWYVSRRSGRPMLDRLSEFLDWLSSRGTFHTMGHFARSHAGFPAWPDKGSANS